MTAMREIEESIGKEVIDDDDDDDEDDDDIDDVDDIDDIDIIIIIIIKTIAINNVSFELGS
jgi:hypothetical protein